MMSYRSHRYLIRIKRIFTVRYLHHHISSNHMGFLILDVLANIIKRISKSFPRLLTLGLMQIALFNQLQKTTITLREQFGAPPPDFHFQWYDSPSDITHIVSQQWGPDGCRIYLRATSIRILYVSIYILLLASVLHRSLDKLTWSTKAVPQIALLLAIAEWGEAALWTIGCRSQSMDISILALADLCHQIKTLSIVLAGMSVIVLMVLKSYIMPLTVLARKTKNPKKKNAPASTKAKRA
jgi:hypothetical protein